MQRAGQALGGFLSNKEGFLGGSSGKEPTCSEGDLDSIPGLGRSPAGGHGNPLQYSYWENPYGPRSLVGYSPWSHKEPDMTEQLRTAQHSISHLYQHSDPLSGLLALTLPMKNSLFTQ